MSVIGIAVFVFVFWVAPTWICVVRGNERGRNGYAWGLLLGWFGVLMIFALPAIPVEKRKVSLTVEEMERWRRENLEQPRS
jgi:hypothetical protein